MAFVRKGICFGIETDEITVLANYGNNKIKDNLDMHKFKTDNLWFIIILILIGYLEEQQGGQFQNECLLNFTANIQMPNSYAA